MPKESAVYWSSYDMGLFNGNFTSQVFPWHFHAEYTVIMVEQGAVSYHFENEVINVENRQVFVVNPYEAHYNKASKASGWTYKVFFLPRSLFEVEGSQKFRLFRRKIINQASLYQQLLDYHAYLEKPVPEQQYANVLEHIRILLSPYLSSSVKTAVMSDRILPAINYIKANLSDKISNDELARLCGISKFYFQRLFKAGTGLTARVYIHQQRMEACRELLVKEQKAGNVAYVAGYFDQSHFSHQFKKMYGITPRKFREGFCLQFRSPGIPEI